MASRQGDDGPFKGCSRGEDGASPAQVPGNENGDEGFIQDDLVSRSSGEILQQGFAGCGAETIQRPAPCEEGLAASSEEDRELDDSQKEHIRRVLESTVAVMTSKVDEMEQQVLQVTRIRSTLKRTKSQSSQSGVCWKEPDKEKGSSSSKRQRLLDAARCEAARRRRMTDIVRQFSNILRQIMQHRWAWPFNTPVDVEGLHLHDYYRVIRKPMDLGTVRSRLEAKDGSGYRHGREMYEDVRLVFRNAMMYNESTTDVHKMAKALLQKFEEKWMTLVEPKLLEEEANSNANQQEIYISEIAELHAGEERAAENLAEDVNFRLTGLEKQLENCIQKLLSNCRAMSTDEKHLLCQRLSELSPSNLNRDQTTLWRLHFFVMMVTNSRMT
eukprot:c22307_g1_i1 orf=128-1282(+)